MVAVDVVKRQLGTEAPSGSGIVQSSLVASGDLSTSALALDTAITPITHGGASFVAPTFTPTFTPSPSPSPSASTDEALVGASGKSIPLGTVIGSCVGAFIGAALLILIGVFYYKRYSRNLKKKASSRAIPRSLRGAKGAPDGEAAVPNSWSRLDGSGFEDKWEGKPAAAPIKVEESNHQMNLLPPLDKMFNKSPSEASHHSTSEPINMPRHPYGQAAASPTRLPEARELLGRETHDGLDQADSGPLISWASDSSKPSFLNSTRLEGGAMSPTIAMAIPTPPAVKSQPHHWESAEVINVPDNSAQVAEVRTSTHNPFFAGGSDYRDTVTHKRNRSQSQTSRTTRSRSNSNATITHPLSTANAPKSPEVPTSASTLAPAEDKSKERVVSIDPFKDPMPAPSFKHHQPTGSASSAADNERAIRNFMEATGMDLDHEEVQRRLKAVSMQPSVISNSGDSMYTDTEPDLSDQEAYRAFPPAPSSSGHTVR